MSAEEIKMMEAESSATIKMTLAGCVLLYLSPFAVTYAGRLIG